MLRFTTPNVRRAASMLPRSTLAYKAAASKAALPSLALSLRRYATESAAQVETKETTKVVQYTVDKYPGYERDARFSQVRIINRMQIRRRFGFWHAPTSPAYFWPCRTLQIHCRRQRYDLRQRWRSFHFQHGLDEQV